MYKTEEVKPESALPILTVSQITFAIKHQLESQFRAIQVQGEISNFKPHSGGHLYFDLKDDQSKISAVLFKADASKLLRQPKEGDLVTLSGMISLYPPHGKYQLIARTLSFAGIGELLLKFEALKKKLEARGWFSPAHKKPLPAFPKRIGVVTSPTGAVIKDIIHVLSRRFAGFHLILNPVRVQGAVAAEEIAQAIRQCNQFNIADVLIVGRGGGSLEDLWAFNEEVVAQAIFESQIPIISAVGHQTDVSLADFVADARAPTPSAAAEIVITEKQQHLHFLKKMHNNLSHALLHILKRYKERVSSYARYPLFLSPYALLAQPMQKLDEQRQHIDQAMRSLLLIHQEKLKRFSSHLKAMDPTQVLQRGYTILFDQKEGSVIVSSKQLQKEQKVRALFSDGERELVVNN